MHWNVVPDCIHKIVCQSATCITRYLHDVLVMDVLKQRVSLHKRVYKARWLYPSMALNWDGGTYCTVLCHAPNPIKNMHLVRAFISVRNCVANHAIENQIITIARIKF